MSLSAGPLLHGLLRAISQPNVQGANLDIPGEVPLIREEGLDIVFHVSTYMMGSTVAGFEQFLRTDGYTCMMPTIFLLLSMDYSFLQSFNVLG